ncbi:hypothetical protein ABBQ38_006222 [Trebouxia sp. C0009 RCD-2024]
MEGTNLARSPRLLCQADSLWRLTGAEKYNLVLMDKRESSLMQLSSETTTSDRAGLVTGVLHNVLLKGDKVVFADAYMTNRTLNLVHHTFNAREDKVKVIYNSWFQEPGKDGVSLPQREQQSFRGHAHTWSNVAVGHL